MIYKLISDTHNYLGFYFDEEQIEDVVEELGNDNIDNFINFSNLPVSLAEIYTTPLDFDFGTRHREDKNKVIPDIYVASGRLFLSEKAYNVLHPLIMDDGEFLPVKYQNGAGYFFNPLKTVEVDSMLSLRDDLDEIVHLAFSTKDTEDLTIFRTEFDHYRGLYCQKSVRQAIEDNNLTGLYITTDLANIFPEDRSSVEKAN